MKNKIKRLSFLVIFAITLVIGFKISENTANASVTKQCYYLQGGDLLSIDTSKITKATLDWANMNKTDGSVKFGYKKNDSTRYISLLADGAKTKKIQACNITGSYTFYINKNNSTKNTDRVKQIVIYIYAKPTNNSTIKLTNSTSTTNNSKVNKPIYLYKGQSSNITVSQSVWGPTVVNASNTKAKSITTNSYSSSNKNVAIISTSGNNFVIKAGNTAGNASITVTKKWVNSNGTAKTTSTEINVYVYNQPTFAIYRVDGDTETKCTGNQYFSWQDIGGITHEYQYMYKATYPSGMSLKSFECTTTDKNTLRISTSLPYITFKPKSHFQNQNVAFSFLVDSPVRTHNGDTASTFKINFNTSFIASNQSYATDIKFNNSTATTTLGKRFSQVATLVPTNAIDKTIYYSIDDTDIATIDKLTGVITPKKHGKVKVYAESATNEKVKTSYTLTIIPDVPTNVGITSTDDGNKLTWSAVKDASSYEVYRATSRNGVYTRIGSTAVLFYYDTKAEYGTQYYYKVTASDEGYHSDYSTIVSVTKKLTTPTISNIKKVGSGIYQIKINGSLYDGFKVYNVNASGTKSLLVTTNSKYATISLETNKSYIFVVRAYKNESSGTIYSVYSTPIRVTIKKDGTVVIGTDNSGDSNDNSGNNNNKNNNGTNKSNQTIINYLTTNHIQYTIQNKKVVLKEKPKKFKVKRVNSKKMKVTWKKNNKIKANVQIKYSTRKNFASSRTNFKLVKANKGKINLGDLFRNKKYYVKIRYRKYVKGVYVYSSYTQVKVVNLRKSKKR